MQHDGRSRRLQQACPCRAMQLHFAAEGPWRTTSRRASDTLFAPPHAQATPDLCLSKLKPIPRDVSPAVSPAVVACELAYSQRSFPSHMYRHTRVRIRYRETACASGLVPWGLSDLPSAMMLSCRESCTAGRVAFNAAVIDHDGTDVNLGPPSDQYRQSELPKDKLCHAERNLDN